MNDTQILDAIRLVISQFYEAKIPASPALMHEWARWIDLSRQIDRRKHCVTTVTAQGKRFVSGPPYVNDAKATVAQATIVPSERPQDAVLRCRGCLNTAGQHYPWCITRLTELREHPCAGG